jgi:hypothetical protein
VENGVSSMLAGYCWSLIRETASGIYRRQRWNECLMMNFFVVMISYIDIVHWRCILYFKTIIVLVYYKHGFWNSFVLLNIGGWHSNLVVIFGFSNIRTVRIALNFNSEFFPSALCWSYWWEIPTKF